MCGGGARCICICNPFSGRAAESNASIRKKAQFVAQFLSNPDIKDPAKALF